MAAPSTRQAIVQAILKRRATETVHKEKKSMKGYIPSYLEGDEKCVVCNDKATGYHYKCITCEGCKGFFRRTVQKNLETSYQCKHSSQCEINKVTRNQCQLCRYNKCISVGMAKDLVLDQEKRVAKRRLIEQNRELRKHKELSQMMAQCGWRIERPANEERRLIHDVTQAYLQANDAQNKTILSIPNEASAADRFSTALTAAITNVVDFAKKIPLFLNDISMEDQVLILKMCCMEIITMRCVSSYKSVTKQVTLFPAVDVTKEQLRFTRLEPFSDSLFTLAEHMKGMELSPVEIALLQAIIIFTGDRPGIIERVRLDHAQNTVIRAFEHHLNELWPHDPQFCPSLLIKLNDVRAVSTCLADTLMSMRMDEPQELCRLFQRSSFAETCPETRQNIPTSSLVETPQSINVGVLNSEPSTSCPQSRPINDCRRDVVRSFSQSRQNGHHLSGIFPTNKTTVNGFHHWKTGMLTDLLGRGKSLHIPVNPVINRLPFACLPNPVCTNGNSFRNPVWGQPEFNGINTTQYHSQNSLSKDEATYETYRNSNNKFFERKALLKTTPPEYPRTTACISSEDSSRCVPSSSRKDRQNRISAPLPDLKCVGNDGERTLHNDNPGIHMARPSLQLPKLFPERFSTKSNISKGRFCSGTKRPFDDTQSQTILLDATTSKNSTATGILLRGLPMSLPYISNAKPAYMELTRTTESHKNDNRLSLIGNSTLDSGDDTEKLNGISPALLAAIHTSNSSRTIIHDLTDSDGDNNTKRGTTQTDTHANADSPSRTAKNNSTATKRVNTSPIFPAEKFKCVSPETFSVWKSSAECCPNSPERTLSPVKKLSALWNGEETRMTYSLGGRQNNFDSVRPKSC